MKIEAVGNNVVINFKQPNSLLQRKYINDGSDYLSFDGENWSEDIALIKPIEKNNFTDYNLKEGFYLYRVSYDTGINWTTSILQKVGAEKVGHTFKNYIVEGDNWGEVLTPDDIRFTYMWGVDFQASNGEIFTDNQIRFYIEAGLCEIERFLSTNFKKRVIKCQPKDGVFFDLEESGYSYTSRQRSVILDQAPILSIDRIELYNDMGQRIADLKENHIVDKRQGKVEIRPFMNSLNISGMGLIPSFARFNDGMTRNVSQMLQVDYTAGYKSANHVPEDIRNVIALIATIGLLESVGDGLIAGFSSSSLSMDGVSESFSSTQSATSAYFGARIKSYKETLEILKEQIRLKFGRTRMGFV